MLTWNKTRLEEILKYGGIKQRQERKKLNCYYFQMTRFLKVGNSTDSTSYDHELKAIKYKNQHKKASSISTDFKRNPIYNSYTKHLEINLTSEVKDLYSENYRTPMKLETDKQKGIVYGWPRRVNTVKIFILSKQTYNPMQLFSSSSVHSIFQLHEG